MKKIFKINIKIYLFRFLCIIPIFGCLFILLPINLEWYDKYKNLYLLWYIPTFIILVGLLLNYYMSTI